MKKKQNHFGTIAGIVASVATVSALVYGANRLHKYIDLHDGEILAQNAYNSDHIAFNRENESCVAEISIHVPNQSEIYTTIVRGDSEDNIGFGNHQLETDSSSHIYRTHIDMRGNEDSLEIHSYIISNDLTLEETLEVDVPIFCSERTYIDSTLEQTEHSRK